MQDFFHMGGYAAFVWPAWGLTALLMLGLVVQTLADSAARKRLLAALEGEGERHRRRAPARSRRSENTKSETERESL